VIRERITSARVGVEPLYRDWLARPDNSGHVTRMRQGLWSVAKESCGPRRREVGPGEVSATQFSGSEEALEMTIVMDLTSQSADASDANQPAHAGQKA
jgi:hypothetical protein